MRGRRAGEEWERLQAVTIDGRAKMENMRSFVSRTERRGGAAQFIPVSSSLVTDEEVDASTEPQCLLCVPQAAPLQTHWIRSAATVPCFLSSD